MLAIAGMFATLMLSACGGGGGDTGGTPPAAPVQRYTVNVTVNGMNGTSQALVLQNNATDNLAISNDGTYAFTSDVADRNSYHVSILTQPTAPDLICSISNPTGTINGAAVNNIIVTCDSTAYSLGFDVNGLAGSGLIVANDAGESLIVSADGQHSFSQPLADGSNYSVFIAQQPSSPEQVCTASNNSGLINGADVNNVMINCVTLQTGTFSIGGRVSGLLMDDFTIQNNTGETLNVTGNGEFTFISALASGDSYSVSILTEPSFNTCTIINNSGTITSNNITGILVNCEPKRYTVQVNITGLVGSGLVMSNHGSDIMAVPANGLYQFARTIPLRFPFNVSIVSQPTTPLQTCHVTNGSGVSSNAVQVRVDVDCVNTHVIDVVVSGIPNGSSSGALLLEDQYGYQHDVTSSGVYEFYVDEGDDYQIRIVQQPDQLAKVCEAKNATGTANDSNIADVQVDCINQVKDIFALVASTCAIVSSQGQDKLKCWGNNSSGKLGLGHREQTGDGIDEFFQPVAEMGDNLPFIELSQAEHVIQVSAGSEHSCALLSNQRVKCWGKNDYGQIGQGANPDDIGDDPAEVSAALDYIDLGTRTILIGGNPQQVPDTTSQITSGLYHNCALMTDGRVKCWGRNIDGELGLDTGTSYAVGDQDNEMGDNLATVNLGTDSNGQAYTAQRIAAGGNHTCALLNNSAVKCWGNNSLGQLGLGDLLDRADDANEMGNALPFINLGRHIENVGGSPQLVPNKAIAIATGLAHSCALLENQSVKCWGWNVNGQLGQDDYFTRGDGLADDGITPQQDMGDALLAVDLGTGRSAIQISTGELHTCVVLDNDQVKCWGLNTFGQLGLNEHTVFGDGLDTDLITPNSEMGDRLPIVNISQQHSIRKITAGDRHTCALLDSNEIKCWGNNDEGQLGLDDRETRGDGKLGNTLVPDLDEMGSNLPRINLGAE